MNDRNIKITVEHEPGCIMTVVFGLLLGIALSGNLGGCVINIGTEQTGTANQTITPAPAGKQ